MTAADPEAETDADSPAPPVDEPEHPVVFFDGVCNLCNGSVQFIIDRDPSGLFRFAPLQSDFARRQLTPHGVDPGNLDSVVLLQDGVVYQESGAVLRVARRLSGLWPVLFYVFIAIPPLLRNLGYRLIAKNRYRLFGREETCRIPTPELRARFLATAGEAE